MKEYKVQVSDVYKEWFLNGERHREDGPAFEVDDGTKCWWLNGQRHREDGPAIELIDGHKEWYLNGKLHREDGPAVEWANGGKDWWLNDQRYSYEDWLKKTQPNPCENKIVTIDGKKYKLVAVS